jgi:hypothetical protein
VQQAPAVAVADGNQVAIGAGVQDPGLGPADQRSSIARTDSGDRSDPGGGEK